MLEKTLFEELNFKFIEPIFDDFHANGPVNPSHLETLSILKYSRPNDFSAVENKIMFLMGLFYKTERPNNFIELIYDIYAQSILESTGRNFTPVQADAFNSIAKYENFSFSAPTSAGKSFLFQELLKEVNGDVVIVVPSRALLSEYLIKIKKIIDKETLVLPFIEIVNSKRTKRKIYIITPERGDALFQNLDKLNIELFLFDEAQLSEEGIRGLKFDAFVRRVDKKLKSAKKVFTHPFIVNPGAQLIKHDLVNSNSDSESYNQKSVGKIFLQYKKEIFKYFSPYDDRSNDKLFYNGDIVEDILKKSGTCLIYISKQKIYESEFLDTFSKYLELCDEVKDVEALGYIRELEDYFGTSRDKKSLIILLMRLGVVIHHGSMPLKARSIIEKFVNSNHAKICFSTSTLIQGINMPFDLVWINNYHFTGDENKKNLDLKNLIGRAGRSTFKKNSFDYGFVVVESKNKASFINRINTESSISEKSMLDESNEWFDEDYIDTVEAIKNDSFITTLNLTKSQVKRIQDANIDQEIKYILDHLISGNEILTGNDYYVLKDVVRRKIKESFQAIYKVHLRRDNLTQGEKNVLSASIPILLWQIQGKSFAEIVSLRHSFLSQRDLRRKLRRDLKNKIITVKEYNKIIESTKVRFSCIAEPLPNKRFEKSVPLFKRGTSIKDVDYDILIYDTYDYIDKVISQSLKDPLSAAFKLYYEKHKDIRSLVMSNYISYGTNDEIEIWLLKYGFTFDEIEWIIPHVQSISEEEIVFNESIYKAIDSKEKQEVIERFL